MRTLILAGVLAIVSVGALAAQSGTRVALEAPHQHKEKLVRLLKQRFPEADAITAVVRDNRLYLCVWDGGQAQVGTLLFDGSLRSQLADLKNTKESGLRHARDRFAKCHGEETCHGYGGGCLSSSRSTDSGVRDIDLQGGAETFPSLDG